MDTELMKIGSRVKQARLAKHLTQMQLAEAAGISVSFLSNIENGRQSMNLRALIAISDALNVSADWLIKDIPHSASQSIPFWASEFLTAACACGMHRRYS